MSMGICLVFFVLGAILSFAVNNMIPNINLELIGYIIMGASAVGFLISLFMTISAKKRVTNTRVVDDGQGGKIAHREDSL